MPEGQRPGGLLGRVARDGHHGAIHQGGQGRNLWGEIEQVPPALPTAAGQQAKGPAMVEGAVEIVGLVPAGQSSIQTQPESVRGRGHKPDQPQRCPPKPFPAAAGRRAGKRFRTRSPAKLPVGSGLEACDAEGLAGAVPGRWASGRKGVQGRGVRRELWPHHGLGRWVFCHTCRGVLLDTGHHCSRRIAPSV